MIAALQRPANLVYLEEAPKKGLVVCKIEVPSAVHCNANKVVSVTVPDYLMDPNVEDRRLTRTFVVSMKEKEKFVEALLSILERL